MRRMVLLVTGPIMAGLFAFSMYSIYGNLNWGTQLERSLPWFEPVFQLLFISGAALLLLLDIYCLIIRKISRVMRQHTKTWLYCNNCFCQ
jgi:hypothetical protein